MYKFGQKSLENLRGVHPKLVELMLAAIKTSSIDFTITEGVRSQARQQQLFKEKKSQRDGIKKKSEHQVKSDGFGHAVDLAPYPIDYKNIQRFKDLSQHIKSTAKKMGISVIYGGDWVSFKDYPHWELEC